MLMMSMLEASNTIGAVMVKAPPYLILKGNGENSMVGKTQ
jgi:hypothetical protein